MPVNWKRDERFAKGFVTEDGEVFDQRWVLQIGGFELLLWRGVRPEWHRQYDPEMLPNPWEARLISPTVPARAFWFWRDDAARYCAGHTLLPRTIDEAKVEVVRAVREYLAPLLRFCRKESL